jgi:hypothetical protein
MKNKFFRVERWTVSSKVIGLSPILGEIKKSKFTFFVY